jgi:protein TonB
MRLFEDLVGSDAVRHKTRTGKTLPVSVAVHALVLLLVVVVPLLTPQDMPAPTSTARAFFVEPAPAPPPPPPPPPPASRPAAPVGHVQRPAAHQESMLLAPTTVPEQIQPDEGLNDPGLEGGVPGGVEGGVPGGALGAVVAGLPEAPPAVPQTFRPGGQIKEPKPLHRVPPTYPEIARQAHVQGTVILECIISPQGKVVDVKVQRGNPLLDQAAIDAVTQWVYTPTLLDGVPVPVILTVKVSFALQ